jgi:hypothetical protein
MQARELRASPEVEPVVVARTSWLDRLRRREPVTEQASATARPV